ncbi:MAG: LON peptidase substrate-binding domain-containing protein [Alphaproteobacteria bacterium]|nr:LON peptidase substrate-binding domain-containing protein [Alphaproteobacteria bacterium]
MSGTSLAYGTAELPATLPIFPLAGVLLLPRGRLPLNIFEPRYLNMTRDALASDRLIGMVQPTEDERPGHPPALYRMGCAGRITQFSETDDGRFLITLTGVARFEIGAEVAAAHGYRRVAPRWERFRGDLEETGGSPVDRPRLMAALNVFFKLHEITADWDAIEATADERLVTSLAMICPFAPNEKQALLEADDLTERARLLTALIEMAALHSAGDGGEAARH